MLIIDLYYSQNRFIINKKIKKCNFWLKISQRPQFIESTILDFPTRIS